MVVVGELAQWKVIIPIVLLLVGKEMQVLLEFLVHSFRLTISLWMISCGRRHLHPQQAIQLRREVCHELWPTIRNYTTGEAMVAPYMTIEEVSGTFSSDGRMGGDEVG